MLMKTASTHELSCSVFGHNLEPVPNHFNRSESAKKFICSSCLAKVTMDVHGEFQVVPYKNDKITTALRQLFLLNRKSSEGQFSL